MGRVLVRKAHKLSAIVDIIYFFKVKDGLLITDIPQITRKLSGIFLKKNSIQ